MYSIGCYPTKLTYSEWHNACNMSEIFFVLTIKKWFASHPMYCARNIKIGIQQGG